MFKSWIEPCGPISGGRDTTKPDDVPGAGAVNTLSVLAFAQFLSRTLLISVVPYLILAKVSGQDPSSLSDSHESCTGCALTVGDRPETENLRPVLSRVGEFSDLFLPRSETSLWSPTFSDPFWPTSDPSIATHSTRTRNLEPQADKPRMESVFQT